VIKEGYLAENEEIEFKPKKIYNLRKEIEKKKKLSKEPFDEFENSRRINLMSNGESFGEISLHHASTRTASIRCK